MTAFLSMADDWKRDHPEARGEGGYLAADSWSWDQLREQFAKSASSSSSARRGGGHLVSAGQGLKRKRIRPQTSSSSSACSSSSSSSSASSSSNSSVSPPPPQAKVDDTGWFHIGGKLHIVVAMLGKRPLPACRQVAGTPFAKDPLQSGIGRHTAPDKGWCHKCEDWVKPI